MGEERDQRLDWKAASIVSKLFVPQQCLDSLDVDGSINALSYRSSTFLILLDEAVVNFHAARTRNHALSLVLIADFCWQFIRALGGGSRKDMEILHETLPRDHDQSDQDTADGHFARQIRIVEDAVWIFELHSFIRHPKSISEKNLWLLKEPVSDEPATRLIRGASGVQQVLRNLAARLKT